MFSRTVLIPLVLGFPALVFAGGERPPEEKLIDELFGKRIAAVRGTASRDDDVALGRQLLIAAYDGAHSSKLRAALAGRVMELTGRVGTQEAADLARRALTLADEIAPVAPVRKAKVRRDIAAGRLSRARRDRRDQKLLADLARKAIRAHLDFVRAVGVDSDLAAQGEGSLRAARGIARSFRLIDLNKVVFDAEKKFRRARAHAARVREAGARLKAARESGSAAGVRAANLAAARLHLEYDGDLRAAGRYLAGTGDPREGPIAAGASFLKDGAIDPATCQDSAEKLTALARSLDEPARAAVAQTTASMLRSFLTTKPPEIAAARGKLLLVQLELMLGDVGGDRRVERLGEAYGGISGKIEAVDDENVRVVYDFSDPAQMDDWTGRGGKWTLTRRSLVFASGARMLAGCSNPLRFRADRPFRLSFDGGAKYAVEGRLAFARWRSPGPGRSQRFSLQSSGAMVAGRGTVWRDAQYKLTEGTWYRCEITSDGRGGLIWSVNGVVLYRRAPGGTATDTEGYLRVELWAESEGGSAAGFRNVVIEGAILPDPRWSPPEAGGT